MAATPQPDTTRKWQEVRLQREAKEKKAAEEYLRRRRRERAQLATYIYSCAQNMARDSCIKSRSSQEHASRNQATLVKTREDFAGMKNHTVWKNNEDESIMLDVCRLPAISINHESNYKPSQKHPAGGEQKGTEATRDFLQEALQERLENEAATSLLIAEITDMRSRLDDLLAEPLKGYHEGGEKAGLESKDSKVSHSLCEKNHEESTNTQLGGVTEDSDNLTIRSTTCSIHDSLATENEASKGTNCLLQNDFAMGNLKANKILPLPNRGACADAVGCEQDKVATEKQFRGNPEGSSLHQKSNEVRFSPKSKVCSAEGCKSILGNVKEKSSNRHGLLCHDTHEQCCILQRISQESCKQEAERDLLAPNEDNMYATIVHTGILAGCKSMKEHPIQNARVALSASKPTCLQAASDLFPTYNAAPIKQLCASMECENNLSFCLKSRRDSNKLLDAEKSLLASLERLDLKLAMASANIQNSSRTSVVSAGHQSTKSAPCAIRRKPGSDAYSVNSTMFLSRPTTSQARGISLISKRRQNVGVTNVSKERVNHLQTCNLQYIKRSPTLSSENHKEDRRPAAGTIIIHQNAEFLFN